MSAIAIDALRLAGRRFGKIDVACPFCGPQCKSAINRKRKVLRIWRHDPDFATFNCARCGEHGCTVEGKLGHRPTQFRATGYSPEIEQQQQDDEQRRSHRALDIWREAVPITGTLGERYLIKRGIDLDQLPNNMRDVLRWHPCCPWESSSALCMVALWTDVISGKPKAIHRTAISSRAERIDRMSLGPARGCLIRLWPDESVEQGLVLGEGVESVLGAATRIEHLGTLLRPAWAAGDAGHMRSFPVLSGIEALTLLVDHDPLDSKTGKNPGQDAAAECAQRWTDAGREVIRLTPKKIDTDFADIVAGEAAP
jgi:putative DNA primase/helicase